MFLNPKALKVLNIAPIFPGFSGLSKINSNSFSENLKSVILIFFLLTIAIICDDDL